MEKGVPFYVRKTNLLRDIPNSKFFANRTLNIPDEKQEKQESDEVFKK